MSSDQMFLLARIEFLQKENDELKEERVTNIQKIEHLKVIYEENENKMLQYQIQMAKIIRKLEKMTKRKLQKWN